nr:hypothetical protein CFP56_56990 [Quercus suber]
MSAPIPSRKSHRPTWHSPPPRLRRYVESPTSSSPRPLEHYVESQLSSHDCRDAGLDPEVGKTRHVRFKSRDPDFSKESGVDKCTRASTPEPGFTHAKYPSSRITESDNFDRMESLAPAGVGQIPVSWDNEAGFCSRTHWTSPPPPPPLPPPRQPQRQAQYCYASPHPRVRPPSATPIPPSQGQSHEYPSLRSTVTSVVTPEGRIPTHSTVQPSKSSGRMPKQGGDDYILSSFTMRLKFGPSESPTLIIKISLTFERGMLPKVKVRSRRPRQR